MKKNILIGITSVIVTAGIAYTILNIMDKRENERKKKKKLFDEEEENFEKWVSDIADEFDNE